MAPAPVPMPAATRLPLTVMARRNRPKIRPNQSKILQDGGFGCSSLVRQGGSDAGQRLPTGWRRGGNGRNQSAGYLPVRRLPPRPARRRTVPVCRGRRSRSGQPRLARARRASGSDRTTRRSGGERRTHGRRLAEYGGRGSQSHGADIDAPSRARQWPGGSQLHPDRTRAGLPLRRGGNPAGSTSRCRGFRSHPAPSTGRPPTTHCLLCLSRRVVGAWPAGPQHWRLPDWCCCSASVRHGG